MKKFNKGGFLDNINNLVLKTDPLILNNENGRLKNAIKQFIKDFSAIVL